MAMLSASLFTGVTADKVEAKTNKANLRLLTSIIYSEAGNQSYAGKKAVGIVIMNRVKSKQFPNTIKGVVYQSGQFSPVRNGSLARSFRLYDRGKIKMSVVKAAASALNGSKTVKYHGKKLNMKKYKFFSGYVAGSKLSIDGHQFK
ncbi:MAG: cell wall hydrolase [Eubacterium sp.]|nr:cell wall hydrolase [Eubacterium sp.]